MTVKVYVPRGPDTVNLARPVDPVDPVAVRVVPLGKVQRMATLAFETAWPRLSLTITSPVMLAVLPDVLPLSEMLLTLRLLAADATFTEISA